jgi:hypothetical protein
MSLQALRVADEARFAGRTLYLLAYDVSDPKRLRKVHKTLTGRVSVRGKDLEPFDTEVPTYRIL